MTLRGATGGCDCGRVRYRLAAEPIVVNCCHCRACQRQTGTAFALNLIIEAAHVELLGDAPEPVEMPTGSGLGQANMRCPACRVSLWSIYHAAGDKARFVRAGTLDDPSAVAPDVHIYTAEKQAWVRLAEDVPQFDQFYAGRDIAGIFGAGNAARWRAVLGR